MKPLTIIAAGLLIFGLTIALFIVVIMRANAYHPAPSAASIVSATSSTSAASTASVSASAAGTASGSASAPSATSSSAVKLTNAAKPK
ncbi:MAG: hypothetical protein K2P84_00615 [Undibacterium sp.]|nr:hypothetical protein [Undibacterium sp.]